MNISVDFFVILISALVQWRVSVLAFRAIDRRFSGRRRQAARAAVLIFGVILAMGYVFTLSAVSAKLPVPERITMRFGAATLTYFAVATAALVAHALLTPLRRMLAADVHPARRRALQTAAGAIVAAPLAALGYGAFVERTDFHVREVDAAFPDLPRDLEGLRILHLSDIHLSAFLSERELARVIDASNELRPQLAAVTGDLISAPGDPLDACIRQLARLRTDAGIFGCMGNHEQYSRCEDYAQKAAARCGIRFLRHASQSLRFGNAVLNLAGEDYQPARKRAQYLHGSERLIVPEALNVMLSHNPDVFPVAARQGYNLLLAGHTHGGQITVEILDRWVNSARFFTPFVYGLYGQGNSAAYVTRGIGTIGIPVRLGAPPEITVVRLRKA
ncbi:MAG TPA: metallophosphoesterase [Bryobacteraceae bacterium]